VEYETMGILEGDKVPPRTIEVPLVESCI